jgi:hypothetical protein
MSGGSYNYLCHADSSDIGFKTEELKDMANRLAELGFTEEANETKDILEHINKTDSMISEITNLWKAIEWMDSGDWGIEEVKEEINKRKIK